MLSWKEPTRTWPCTRQNQESPCMPESSVQTLSGLGPLPCEACSEPNHLVVAYDLSLYLPYVQCGLLHAAYPTQSVLKVLKTTPLNCCNILSSGFDDLSGPLIPYFLVISNLLHPSDSSKQFFFLFYSFHNSYLTHPPNPLYNRSALLPLVSKGLSHTSSSDLPFPCITSN